MTAPGPAGVLGTGDATDLLGRAREAAEGFVADLVELTSFDSGTWNPAGTRRAATWCADRLRSFGARTEIVEVHRTGPPVGPALVARLPVPGPGTVLLVGHTDTVYPDGTAAARPAVRDGDRLIGPGVSDDKGGVLAGIHAMRLLADLPGPHDGEVVLLLSPDEEVGSPQTVSLLTALAREADVVLGLECARENGDLVLGRKGACDVTVELRGRAAHAGIEPERGIDAAAAAAALVLSVRDAAAARPGVTINVGVLRAGTRPNVVADRARLEIEVRAPSAAALDEALLAVDDLVDAVAVGGVSGTTERSGSCPPLEPTPASRRLLDLAVRRGRRTGLAVDGALTGGVSDANFAAATGTPTLDGLGPVGGGDHSAAEWLDVATAPARIALLAGLVLDAGRLLAPQETPSRKEHP
ncbi:M20/M25/M40 family metallo-hydrolase [Isoptericola sp. S6320L]|uniref:M20/M25/M40 family metallo-hydrolase n=1 Tax=Isoptericola sp. S6320L TaxID=2926411 RepID=UPI001FF159C9|nr:M20/M25/M40 family metallo-hydrolase [Isoptericola sp. S6320L]MCK0117410.1 M20/M25/M40 family metallo-hydrolase [Isoptericola sp. S6320L]